MRKARPPDVKALERGAKKSQDKESFQVLAKMRNYRIGVEQGLILQVKPASF
jgi:hypothetical protein